MLYEKFFRLTDRLGMFLIKAHCKADEIKRDENAMEVIQVVMLIAVGVLAIVAVWAGVNGFLTDIWEIITGGQDRIPEDLEL
jgi:hypothetical protein